ncbi:glucose-1-phosphate cytidylyltransferase [Fibrobacterota bacterium]
MKVAILCGGLGTRLSEETVVKPKPMVEIGGHPILWHVMKIYASYGFKDFLLALGYKGLVIKEFFINYHLQTSNVAISLSDNQVTFDNSRCEDWNVHMVDTGEKSMTGGRVRRLKPLLDPQEAFMLTYGDGVADIDLGKLLKFHKSHGKLATVTAVRPTARFGTMSFDGGKVTEFKEKAQTDTGWINGGFFVFEPRVMDYFSGDSSVLEEEPLENMARDGELMVYKHEGFWQCMDTLRDRNSLDNLCRNNAAPWITWEG